VRDGGVIGTLKVPLLNDICLTSSSVYIDMARRYACSKKSARMALISFELRESSCGIGIGAQVFIRPPSLSE
jgi:hypothetical protein